MPSQPALAITNQKGGVAKTTTAVNLGGALNAIGYDTLLIDLDPQGYLTNGVGLEDEYLAESPTLYDALTSPSDHTLSELAVEHPEFDVIPANIDMFGLEQELVSAMQGRLRVTQLLNTAAAGYDVALIDCPPSLGLLTDNALLAAQNTLIPAEAEDTSIRALELLSKQIDTLEENFDTAVTERGIVVSNVDYPLDNDQKEMLQWFDRTYGEYVPVFEVRRRAAIKRAYNHGVSIFEYDEDCDQLDELQRIAQHIADAVIGGDE